jgi:hypothetical protein
MGLKWKKEAFLGCHSTFNKRGKSSRIQAYFAERAPNKGESI